MIPSERVPEFSEAWGEWFITKMRLYMEGLELSVDDEAVAAEVETISGVPYCGCEDCVEREYGLMAVKLAIEGYEAGLVRLQERR